MRMHINYFGKISIKSIKLVILFNYIRMIYIFIKFMSSFNNQKNKQINQTNQLSADSKQKKFVIKERSLSSLPSKHFSVSEFMNQKQGELSSFKTLDLLKKNEILSKNKQINQLQQRLKGALNLAISQKLSNSKKKEDAYFDQKMRKWFQYKVKQLQSIISYQREKHSQCLGQLQDCKKLMEIAYQQKDKLTLQRQQKDKQITRLMLNFNKIQKLQLQLKDIGPLKQRIKTLQLTLRQEKIKFKSNKKQFNQIQKQNEQLINELSKQKPYQEQLKQQIAYLERVNLDVSRKMEDFNRRQNQYIKTTNIHRNTIAKITNERNNLQTDLQNMESKYQTEVKKVQSLQSQVKNKNGQIYFLKDNLKRECDSTIKLTKELEQTIAFYKNQTEQNKDLKKRNKVLQEHQNELRRTIQHYQKVNDQVNLTIVSRTQQIQKLTGMLDLTQQHLDSLEEKFYKFQIIFQEKSEKGSNQIKQFFYKHIRENNKLNLTVKEMRADLQERIFLFGEQRDALIKKSEVRSIPLPDDYNLYQVVYQQKKQELILLQGSNQLLLKIKKDLQNRLFRAQQKLQQQKRQSLTLKLKAADVFKARKQVEDARKSAQRYQEMIQQQKLSITDLQSQLKVLRQKIIMISDKNFQLQLQNKNNQIQMKKMDQIIDQLNAKKLNIIKRVNQKKSHLISDSIQKLQNGIKSLSFFFTCCFCHQTNSMLVTLANCGHNFCLKPKCKQAYSQYCYQCDTGMPIERIFPNKYLKEAVGKYNFLQMQILKQFMIKKIKANKLNKNERNLTKEKQQIKWDRLR